MYPNAPELLGDISKFAIQTDDAAWEEALKGGPGGVVSVKRWVRWIDVTQNQTNPHRCFPMLPRLICSVLGWVMDDLCGILLHLLCNNPHPHTSSGKEYIHMYSRVLCLFLMAMLINLAFCNSRSSSPN